MIVPDHWAEAHKHHRAADRHITIRRFGWSTLSEEDAVAMAERRAGEALRRLIAGETLRRREPKVPYNGADGVPIREEVLSRHGDEVITRNAYGAHCLNSPSVLFADVDFEPPSGASSVVVVSAVAVLVSTLVGISQGNWRLGLVLGVASMFLSVPVARFLRGLIVAVQGGAEALAHQRVTRFVNSHTTWNVRVYRTPAGFRLLATHRSFHPGDPEVAEFFQAVGADPTYRRMCRNQNCFRARLTAKPWRIGIASHMRPRPGVWPVAPERMALRNSWVAEYEERARNFASCRYLESLGSGVVDQKIQPVVDLHDRASRASDINATIA